MLHWCADLAGHGEGLHAWSEGVHVSDLRHQIETAAASGSRLHRLLTCAPAFRDAAALRFCLGGSLADDGVAAAAGSIQLHLAAPLVLHNALPMPIHVVAHGITNWTTTR